MPVTHLRGYVWCMSLVALHGHERPREQLRDALARGVFPASLLLSGPRGIGKQRLALWLGQMLLCQSTGQEPPCESCRSCRYASSLTHPDLHWYFPRPRLKDADPDPEDVLKDIGEAIAERVESAGLYPAPSGADGIFVATVRAILQKAAMTPALGARKVFVVGDADRMVPQTGADAAANAFLKLLEEPPANTYLLLTSSEPGSLLPTIRSRVVTIRIPRLTDAAMSAFLSDPVVAARPGTAVADADRIRSAAGSPGALLAPGGTDASYAEARRLLDVALGNDRAALMSAAMRQGVSKARGSLTDILGHLTALLNVEVRRAALAGDLRRALGAARAVETVEEVKEMAAGNVSPQLASTYLLSALRRELNP